MATEIQQDGEEEQVPMKVTLEMLGASSGNDASDNEDDESEDEDEGEEEEEEEEEEEQGTRQNSGTDELVEVDLGLLLASDGNLVAEDKNDLEAW